MILGKDYEDKKKKKGTPRVGRMFLKRKTTNTPGTRSWHGTSCDYKPMTNSANASVTRSLKSLKERGIIKYPPHSDYPEEYLDYHSFTLTDKEGLRVYKDLKKTK